MLYKGFEIKIVEKNNRFYWLADDGDGNVFGTLPDRHAGQSNSQGVETKGAAVKSAKAKVNQLNRIGY